MAGEIKGAAEAKRRLAKAGNPAAGVTLALVASQARIGRASIPLVPVDTGVLRASWVAPPPIVRATGATAAVGYGGAASRYAAVQHERVDYAHRVGQAKFLSQPIQRMAGTEVQLIAAAVKAWLGKAGA